jgi:prophage regulatory protein
MTIDGKNIDQILREKAVLEATGWSHATLWKRIADGQFKKPVKLGQRAVGWFASDIAEHQARLRKTRDD